MAAYDNILSSILDLQHEDARMHQRVGSGPVDAKSMLPPPPHISMPQEDQSSDPSVRVRDRSDSEDEPLPKRRSRSHSNSNRTESDSESAAPSLIKSPTPSVAENDTSADESSSSSSSSGSRRRVPQLAPPQRQDFPVLDGIEAFKSLDAMSFIPRVPADYPKSDISNGVLVVPRFQPMMLVGCKRTLILGMPGGGKSHTLLWLVYELREFYGAFVAVNPSENSNQLYSSCLPNIYCHNVFDSKLCNRIVNRQSMAVGELHNPMTLFIMDDCTEAQATLACPAMRIMWLRGRHIGAAVIAASQYTVQLPTFCRSSVSYVVLTLCNSGRDMKTIYNDWASAIFPTYASFHSAYTTITKSSPYTHMVLMLNSASTPTSECVFYLRAPSNIPSQFEVGHPQYRSSALQRTDPDKVDVIPFMQHYT